MIYIYYGRAKMEISNTYDLEKDSYPNKPKSLFMRDETNTFYKFTYGVVLRSVKLFKNKKYFIILNKLGRIKSIKPIND